MMSIDRPARLDDPDPKRRKRSSAAEELLCEKIDPCIGKGTPSRPGNDTSHGPNLRHQRVDFRRQLPASDDASAHGRTHDVNDEMLAKAYRRGLRVGVGYRSSRQSLDFLFGD
jgi:hypothetical protein